MSSTIFDDKPITFPCPKCGKEVQKTIGWLKSNKSLICVGCGVTIKLDTDKLARGTEEAQKLIDGIPKKLTIKL